MYYSSEEKVKCREKTKNGQQARKIIHCENSQSIKTVALASCSQITKKITRVTPFKNFDNWIKSCR